MDEIDEFDEMMRGSTIYCMYLHMGICIVINCNPPTWNSIMILPTYDSHSSHLRRDNNLSSVAQHPTKPRSVALST